MRVKIDIDGFRTTQTGKPKIWQSDLGPTYCCCLTPSYFIWEKNTKHNEYNAYYGYIDCKYVEVL
ncbi:hypothetical protein LCGC14_3100100 [marine sediment metagenome]|uniref:Uncharacterized protein n=1 Tax=marine sediment metagenome TaxID=412755 RepID=A0A0F8W806_9ZZZZ